MNIALWIAQAILGIYLIAGFIKLTTPIDKLAAKMPWVTRFDVSVVRFIGLTQILGAIGVILPWLLDFAPILTPLAATGLAITQLLAMAHHAQHKELKQSLPINLFLFAVAVFVAIGRF